MNPAVRKAPKLGLGKRRKLLARYQDAHRAFARGQFPLAIARYQRLSDILRPHFAEITAKNLGLDVRESVDLNNAEVQRVLAGKVLERLRPGTAEAQISGLCSAVSHDLALICRHLAEASERGRDPEIAETIIKGFAHAIAVNPQNPVNYHNLAGYEDFLGRDTEACGHYRAALELNPAQWESWVSWGHACGRLGDRDDAETCWTNALNIVDRLPKPNERRWPLAMLRLLKGDYARGWNDYEGRLTFPTYVDRHGRRDLRTPFWNGQRTGTLLLHAEQGAGDAIMMARYIPLAAERAQRVIVEVIAGMATLFEALTADCANVFISVRGEKVPEHDVQLPMFSLPYTFGTTLDTIPDQTRFEVDSADGVPIQPESGRIGLCWRGSATHSNDLVRSLAFESCFPLLDVPGITWQSLQFGVETAAPLDPLPLGDFLETARAIARCSLVITVDTSVAHLAGVMGVPTWLLLPFIAEWRWLQDRDDTPWYPSLRLWRQSRAGDWRTLIDRVAAELRTGHASSTTTTEAS